MRGIPVSVLLLPVLLAGGPGALWGRQGAEEVTRLRFEGNRQFRDEVLANAIITRETECTSPVLLPFCWAGADFSLEPYYFSPREFGRDEARLRLFYYQRGYRETVVDTVVSRPSPGTVEILFRIQEGDPVRVESVVFSGLEGLPDSTVAADLPLRVGDPLSIPALDAARDSLVTRLRNRGYAHADVLTGFFLPTATPYQAEVTLDAYPGTLSRFGPLTVSGNVTVSEAVVRRMLPFRPGNLYSQDLRYVGQRNLYNLDIFTFADIIPDTTFVPDSIVPLSITVAEGQLHRVRTGIGLTTADCLTAEARWASRNFFGGARRLQITGRGSNVLASALKPTPLCADAGTGKYGRLNWLLSVDFNQPWLLSPRNSFAASIFGERQSFPELFVRQALGLNLALTHTLTLSTPLTFSYRPQLSSLDAAEVSLCTNYLVCTEDDIRILQNENRLSPLGMSLSRDRRNQPLNPTDGYSALVDVEHADDWTGSDFRYSRVLAEGTWYTSGRRGWVLATRLRGGWVGQGVFRPLSGGGASSDIIHPEKRLYAGGANSVRGFAQNRMGPQVLQVRVDTLLSSRREDGTPLCTPAEILAPTPTCDANGLPDDVFSPRPTGGTSTLEGSVEFRFRVAGPIWEGAAFLDFGQVWGESQSVSLAGLEYTPGMGIRYFSPIGPIRVDLAYRFAGGEELEVVTSNLRPFVEGEDDPKEMLKDPSGNDLGYVASKELAILSPRVLYGELRPWSLRRFQLHLSIGQAF